MGHGRGAEKHTDKGNIKCGEANVGGGRGGNGDGAGDGIEGGKGVNVRGVGLAVGRVDGDVNGGLACGAAEAGKAHRDGRRSRGGHLSAEW